MKYIFLGNNRTALEVLRWLVDRGQPPSGLVVHPQARARFRDELIEVARLPENRIFEATELRDHGAAWVRGVGPDWLISVLFGFMVRADVLAAARNGGINLHPALLPYNRGASPNVWSIVEGTPAGVTLHMMTPELDAGDIIAQAEVPVLPSDTGASLYRRLEETSVKIFAETWPSFCDESFSRTPQRGSGTYHRVADLTEIDRIDPDKMYRAGEIINIIRARTFSPHKGAYLDLGDCRVYLQLILEEERVAAIS